MKALILAGGLGTRLKSTVSDVPKPMAPVGGRPFLTYQIEWLKKNNITDIVFCVGYMADYIKNFFGDGSHLGLKISYAEEEELLGTAGALKNAEEFIDKVRLALEKGADEQRLREFARVRSWQARSDEMASLILEILREKGYK